jgi:hypothetical protein
MVIEKAWALPILITSMHEVCQPGPIDASHSGTSPVLDFNLSLKRPSAPKQGSSLTSFPVLMRPTARVWGELPPLQKAFDAWTLPHLAATW